MNCFRRKKNETNDNRQYGIPIRKFALTLFAHSPKAYKYVREKFSNTLPHPRTMKKWYSQSDCNGEVGILPEALKTLQNASAELAKNGKTLLASLAFDEMAIRRHIQYDHQKKEFLGFSQYGNLNKDGKASVSNNVLVFMVTVLNYQLSIPVAYYPITSLTCYEKRDLLVEILTSLHDNGVKIINVTFDGLASNPSTCELLGASFDPKNIVPCFPLPVDDYPVYILLDSCHMLKLLRNALGDLKTINDPTRGSILWKHFEELESFRVNNKFVTHHQNDVCLRAEASTHQITRKMLLASIVHDHFGMVAKSPPNVISMMAMSKKYKCANCQYSTNKKSSFDDHCAESCVTEAERNMKCPICDQMHTYRTLRLHLNHYASAKCQPQGKHAEYSPSYHKTKLNEHKLLKKRKLPTKRNA